MSEAGTNFEIEDVLSSIRRLVSQDGAVGHAAAPVHASFATRRQEPAPVAALRSAPAQTAEEADCLVLTPALRVEDEPDVAEEDLGDELSRLESTIAQLEASVAESGIAFEPELGDHFEAEGMPSLSDESDEVPEGSAAEVAGEEPTAEDDVADPVHAFSSEEFIWARAMMVVNAAAAAERLDALDPAEEDVILEAETLHDLPVTPEAEEEISEGTEAIEAEVDELAVELEAVEEADLVTLDTLQEDVTDLELDEDVAEPRAVEAEATDEEAEPDERPSDVAEFEQEPVAEEVMLRRASLADAEETRQRPEILRSSYETLRAGYEAEAHDAAEATTAPNLFAEGSGATMLDEEALRDLVAELIRQELQGRLGERITQNVRKLVRREIQRALVSREFE